MSDQGPPNALTVCNECSKELWRQLTDPDLGWAAGSKLAAQTPSRSELLMVAEALEIRGAPAGDKAVIAMLTPLVSLYGVSDKGPAEWRVFWKFYINALQDLPREALEAGAADYVSRGDSEFFPKPGPLKAICQRKAEMLLTALGRARRAVVLSQTA